MRTIIGYVMGKPTGCSATIEAENGMYAWLETVDDGHKKAYTFDLKDNKNGTHTIYVMEMKTAHILYEAVFDD